MRQLRFASLIALTVTGLFASTAHASITVTLDSVTLGASSFYPSDYVWSYTATVDTTDGLNSSSYFTLYDFDGAIDTIEAPAHWSLIANDLIGLTPKTLSTPDNPHVANLTFGFDTDRPGQIFASFWIVTPVGTQKAGHYSWIDNDTYPGGDFQFGTGLVAVAGAGDGEGDGDGTAAVPEPTAWSLMILAFGALGSALRRRALTQTRPSPANDRAFRSYRLRPAACPSAID